MQKYKRQIHFVNCILQNTSGNFTLTKTTISLNRTDNQGLTFAAHGTIDYIISSNTLILSNSNESGIIPEGIYNYAEAYLNRGNQYARKGDYRRAIADYTQAVKINPNLVLAYYNRGNAYGYNRDFNRAFADFEKVLQLDPNYPNAKENLEQARQLRGR